MIFDPDDHHLDDYADQDYYERMREEFKGDAELEDYFFQKFQTQKKEPIYTEHLVHFQVLFSIKNWESVLEKCFRILHSRLEEDNSFKNKNDARLSLGHYFKRKKGGNWFVGFYVDFLGYHDCVALFIEILEEQTECKWVWKFSDYEIEKRNQKYYRRISRLEMNLREVLSYILWDTYGEKKDLLRDYNMSVKGKPTEMENDLFCISFADYKDFRTEKLKKIDYQEVFASLRNFDDFEEWRDDVTGRGIQKQEYEDFVASIKNNMEIIEKARNCISHFRYISEDDIASFERACEYVEGAIDAFWEREKEAETED